MAFYRRQAFLAPDLIASVNKPQPLHGRPQFVSCFEGKEWGLCRDVGVRGQVMFKGTNSTAFALGVRQVYGVTFGFSLGVWDVKVDKL